MATTGKGIRYPLSSDHTRLWEHFLALAEDVDLRYPQTFDSDASFPVAASFTAETDVIDRYTVAAVPWARRFTLMCHAYMTSTQTNQQQDLILVAGETVLGRARGEFVSLVPITLKAVGQHDLAANTAVVFEARVARILGTGTGATSISGALTASSLIATPS